MEQRDNQRQRVVWVQARHSHLMEGDPLPEPAYDGAALPALLQAGWRISETVTGPSGVYFILVPGSSAAP